MGDPIIGRYGFEFVFLPDWAEDHEDLPDQVSESGTLTVARTGPHSGHHDVWEPLGDACDDLAASPLGADDASAENGGWGQSTLPWDPHREEQGDRLDDTRGGEESAVDQPGDQHTPTFERQEEEEEEEEDPDHDVDIDLGDASSNESPDDDDVDDDTGQAASLPQEEPDDDDLDMDIDLGEDSPIESPEEQDEEEEDPDLDLDIDLGDASPIESSDDEDEDLDIDCGEPSPTEPQQDGP
ncbi:hypothetical protein CALVIDRAFT_603627, partial [Calocera viscosa TUFC12733]